MENKKERIRSQLEECKKTFDDLITTLSNEQWNMKYPNQPFSIGEVMMQLANRLGFIPQMMSDIKKKKGFFNPPVWITKIIQFFFNGFYGRNLTPEEIRMRYALAHANILEVLEHIHDVELKKGAVFFGKFTTIEEIFKNYFAIFEETIAVIQQLLTVRNGKRSS